MVSKALFSSRTDEWATPGDLFDRLNLIYSFDLDVCATHDNAKCKEFFDAEKDGLAQSWRNRRCWMNPPYSQIAAWMKKADQEAQEGALVVCLVPARTDTKWFHEYAKHHRIEFIRGRLRFGHATNSAPFPSILVIMG